MNWGAFAWWALLAILVGLVAYLEFGWGRVLAKRREEAATPTHEVRDVTTVDVRCSDCGRLIGLGVNVVTGDLVQHISLGQIVMAIGAHRERHHEAVA